MTTGPSSSMSSPSRRRTAGPLVALLATVLIASACIPYWTPGSVATAAESGPYVLVTWDAAIDEDEDQDVEHYTIDVGGQTIGTVDHPETECLLIGLAASTTYTVEVFADGSSESSREIGENDTWLRTVSTGHTTGAVAQSGTTVGCVSTTDADGDRLPDAVETNTGSYRHAADTGTNPLVADSDGDGLADGDEVLGTIAGLDLPAMGTLPVHKDLLMEFDWFDDNAEPGTCGPHSHQPTTGAVSMVSDAFGNSPVVNLDGTTGVNLIADYGQGGVFAGGNHVPDADGVIAGNVFGSDFRDIRTANFAADRAGYFHYTLLPHRYNTNSSSSGYAEFKGDDLIVSLYCYGSDGNVANTIMHEVGHNLGLWHGGDEFTNYMWNYNSVMNYLYQFPGVDTDCVLGGDGLLDFSSGQRAPLDETALVEANGVCGGVAQDWNRNSVIDGGTVTADVNGPINGQGNFDGDSAYTTLTDHDDWSNLFFAGAAAGAGLGRSQTTPIGITEQPVPASARD